MKKLNTVTFSDIVNGFECSYKKFVVTFYKGYVNVFYNGKNIDTFMCTTLEVSALKNKIKFECNLRDINFVKKLTTTDIKKYFSHPQEVEDKIISYCNLQYMHKTKNIDFLLNECKNYFIYR